MDSIAARPVPRRKGGGDTTAELSTLLSSWTASRAGFGLLAGLKLKSWKIDTPLICPRDSTPVDDDVLSLLDFPPPLSRKLDANFLTVDRSRPP